MFEQGGISSDEYMNILYEGLISIVDDLMTVPEDANTITIVDESTLLFIHDNVPCYKSKDVTDLLWENDIHIIV